MEQMRQVLSWTYRKRALIKSWFYLIRLWIGHNGLFDVCVGAGPVGQQEAAAEQPGTPPSTSLHTPYIDTSADNIGASSVAVFLHFL